MATPTQVYVDPAIAANSGTGTIADPYGDLQYAVNTQVRDATNGDQFNVKAGTSEILAVALSWTTYGTPTVTAPCIIRGYTATANDGGQGVVSGNGSVACINSGALASVKLMDMRFTNCGAQTIVNLGNTCVAINCEFDTSTGSGCTLGTGMILNCYFHNIGVTGAQANHVAFCTFRNETNDFTQAITTGLSNSVVMFNLIDIDGASRGVNVGIAGNTLIAFNSIYSNAGTGVGIRNATSSHTDLSIINNTVVGFSGVGGVGIEVTSQNANVVGYNLLFNNTTNTSITGDVNIDLGNNTVAGAIPFIDAPNDDFDPIAGLSVGYPTTWKTYTATQQNLLRMAAQYAASLAGGGRVIEGGVVVR